MGVSELLKPVLAVGAVALLAGSAAASPARPVRLGAAPELPSGSRTVGALATSAPLQLTVTLKPRDPAALEQYATAVSTPGSSAYHHFLSVAQFRQQFGPTDAQIAALEDSLRAHGLRPGSVSANGLALEVSSSVGVVGRAFSTSFRRVALRSGRVAFANTRAPLLDSSVAGLVQAVLGLNDLALAKPVGLEAARDAHTVARSVTHVATGGPQPCSYASDASVPGPGQQVYTTDQIASAYGFSGLYNAGDEGAGQTVAIYELEGNFHSDINAYESCYGIDGGTAGDVSYVPVGGGPDTPDPSSPAFDGLETELDIENVIGLAPGANVIVYQGNQNPNNPAGAYNTYNAIIGGYDQNHAHVVTSSWGLCENDLQAGEAQSENILFEEAATQGQTVFAAAGDDGSEDCQNFNPKANAPLTPLFVDDPASQPFVTGAGGTRMSAIGMRPTESVWNDSAASDVCQNFYNTPPSPSPCGGGGGISTIWPMPTWQSGAAAGLHVTNANSSGTPCGAAAGSYCREVPDVSGNADPATGYSVYYDGNGVDSDTSAWTQVGGTSAVAPLWAGLMADIDAYPACNGTPVGFANPVLYGIGSNDAYASDFNDITVGNNDILDAHNGLYPAGAGYDMASGLGTPNAAALASTICAPAIGFSSPGTQTTRLHARASLQIRASDSGGYALSYSATGLPPGLSISDTSGVISGTATKIGSYNVTVRAVDTRSSIGSTTFNWKVAGRPKESRASLTGVGRGSPKLSFTLKAGTDAPKLRKIVIRLPSGVSFGSKRKKRDVTVNGSHRLSFRLSGRKLTITLRSAVTKARVTIAAPALRANRSVIGHRVTITLRATDATGYTTRFNPRLKPS